MSSPNLNDKLVHDETIPVDRGSGLPQADCRGAVDRPNFQVPIAAVRQALHGIVATMRRDHRTRNRREVLGCRSEAGLPNHERMKASRFSSIRPHALATILLQLSLVMMSCVPSSETGIFRIRPQRPVPELEAEARAAVPPRESGEKREPELVDLASLDPTLQFDIRYAGTNNFMGTPFYRQAKAWLQRPVAEALLEAHRQLQRDGFGLRIFDASPLVRNLDVLGGHARASAVVCGGPGLRIPAQSGGRRGLDPVSSGIGPARIDGERLR